MPEEYSFIRYLEAKRTVDDRALNRGIWRHLLGDLEVLQLKKSLQVLEVGTGLGTMLERMVEWGLSRDLKYTALDWDPSLVSRATERLSHWARYRGCRIDQREETCFFFEGSEQRIDLELICTDFLDFAKQGTHTYDLLVTHAFLDLVHLETALPAMFSCLRPGGLFYFTLVFDGASIFRPPVDPEFDALVESCYHVSMDERGAGAGLAGHSQTGRMLLETLLERQIPILAAGSSDWVVYPPYPEDEAYFLHHILHFMEDALKGCPDLDPRRLEQWLETRHRQVEADRLTYIAHQLDVLGQWTPP
jgi:SAM-dependent methyltransferase